MNPDPGLEATRDIRTKISREHGNGPARLVQHYLEYQRRFAGRLIPAPVADAEPPDANAGAAVTDAGTRRR